MDLDPAGNQRHQANPWRETSGLQIPPFLRYDIGAPTAEKSFWGTSKTQPTLEAISGTLTWTGLLGVRGATPSCVSEPWRGSLLPVSSGIVRRRS